MLPAGVCGREAAVGVSSSCSARVLAVATGSFTFTLGDRGVMRASRRHRPRGTCTGRRFYPVCVSLTVSRTAGSAVTGFTHSDATPGGSGTTSVVTSNTPAAGSAVVIGSGQATLTFTTNGPAGAARLCQAPNFFGSRSHGREGRYPQGELHRRGRAQGLFQHLLPRIVYSQGPQRAHSLSRSARPIALTVSLGHRL